MSFKILILSIIFIGQPIVLASEKCQTQPLLPVIKVNKKCPQGFRSSGGYCIPISDKTDPVIPIYDGKKVEKCPLGYRNTRGYCQSLPLIKTNSLPRVKDNCPLNYYKNKGFCTEICK